MEGYAYYNGKIGRCDDISIPLSDRLIYFGDGVYDVMIGHSGKLFLVDDHIERLFSGISALNIYFSMRKDDILDVVNRLIKLSEYKSYLVYISVSRDADERKHSYIDCTSANLLVTIKEFSFSYTNDLKLITMPDNRYGYCNIKTVNLLPSVMASTKAEAMGCDEAVFVRNGTITECAHSNIFIIKDEMLITHPESCHILPGIIRKFILKNAAVWGITAIEREFSADELIDADEVLVTSTTKLAKRAESINGIKVGGKNSEIANTLIDTLFDSYRNI
jgi:D-alanine transaminase